MTERYFEKFPQIFYNNKLCRDITRRVAISGKSRNDPYAYYPLELNSGMRPDALAEAYFEDAEADWLIYLSNQIVDPYYGWYLDQFEFANYINDKYGSEEVAIKEIAYYRNNWYNDEREISVQFYNHTISARNRKYYSPIYGHKDQIIGYKRTQQDWLTNTNRIQQYAIESNTLYVEGETVDFYYSGNVVGGAVVVTANTSSVIVQHTSGNTSANSTGTKFLAGETSGANVESNTMVILAENFTIEEGIYWSPVTMYDLEVEYNESKKSIKILDSRLLLDTSETLRQKLAQE
jgi:hypothetical protein